MAKHAPKAIPRNKLLRGEWYHGDGWAARIALWDGEYFRALRPAAIGPDMVTLSMGYCADVEGFTPHRMVL